MKQLIAFLFLSLTLTGFAQQKTTPFVGNRNVNPFKTIPETSAVVTYNNPVLPGFYSDPSVCRVGDDYYLITSTFEYYPGVPVFHSKDLVNWEQIGHCIHRKEQLPNGINIFAATLRYNNGTFYMITTNIGGKGNFYVTAENPAGPWSDPIWIKAPGIDPDLFFDDDGKAYVISSPFVLYEVDIKTGEFISEGLKVWNSTGGRYAEAPHIYKKDGFYYLMAAEGGTEEAHSVTISRSSSIWGPYTAFRANPIATHVTAAGQGNPIQGIGHADIIQSHNDSWWIMLHGYRTISDKAHHILGRETCLAPVEWPKNGWPIVNGNGTFTMNMTCPTLPLKPVVKKPARIDFNTEKLGLEWNYIQNPETDNFSLEEREGYLRLKGASETINTKEHSTFVGRRLQHHFFTASTELEFEPNTDNEEAGMVLVNNGSHFDLLVIKEDGERKLVVKLQFGQTTYKSKAYTLKPGSIKLRIDGNKSSFSFSYAQGNDDFKKIETVDSKFLATETVGFFTGVYVGFYSTGNGKSSTANADYNWFNYSETKE